MYSIPVIYNCHSIPSFLPPLPFPCQPCPSSCMICKWSREKIEIKLLHHALLKLYAHTTTTHTCNVPSRLPPCRITTMTQDEDNVTRPPHLPRLRNRASLGRLEVFGGVLDFQGHSTSTDRTTTDSTLPAMPLIPTLYSHLAGPASSCPSSSRLNQEPLMQSHNKQHDPPIQSTQHTPVKNTNSSSTLRALQASNQQQQGVKYPNSLSKGRPRAIPRLDLDFDHHHQHKQHQSRRISNRRQEHDRPQSESVSTSAQSSIDHSLLDSDEDVSQELEEATTRIKKEEEERLVNEIRQDMDEGGYASLEQVGQCSTPFILSLAIID